MLLKLGILKKQLFVSVVMPCLNEEKTVGICVKQAQEGLKKTKLLGEVIVCDNGSTDRSIHIAKSAGAKIVFESQKGYGSAYHKGIKAACGQLIIIGDSDGTYNFKEALCLLKPLYKGYDLVIGSRLKGNIKKNSMPFLNRYLGTPFLNLFLRIFFNLHVSDSQSGMRAFTKLAFNKLKLKTLGMEFASEMIIRASQEHLKITEAPISYSSRVAPAKLSRFKDGWRHIRFMLLFAPTYLFLIPGGVFMGAGFIGMLTLSQGPIWIFNKGFDFHSMILASMFILVGYQIIMLGIYAKIYSWLEGFSKEEKMIVKTLQYFRLEEGIMVGFIISTIGLLMGMHIFINWANQGFGSLSAIRPAIVSMTFFILGIQILFSSFYLSLLGFGKEVRLNKKNETIKNTFKK